MIAELIADWPEIESPGVTEILRDEHGNEGSVDLVHRRIAKPRAPSERPAEIGLKATDTLREELRALESIPRRSGLRSEASPRRGRPAQNFERAANGRVCEVARRGIDIALAVLILTATLPLLLVVMALIRLESPGSPLFRQERMGRGGRRFRLLKLRGMYTDAQERFPQTYDYRPEAIPPAEDYFFHSGDETDPRVTRMGRFCRRFSLDEIPNFVNVLRGEMSVVGPRPELPELAHLYGDQLEKFLSVKPGVTSPAKTSGRDSLSFSQTLAMDLGYVDRRSLRLDIRTILATARCWRGHGVR